MKMPDPIHGFKEILDSLDTTGGHMFVWMCVMGMGITMLKRLNMQEGKELITAGLTGIGYAMRGIGKANGVGSVNTVVESSLKTK